MTIFQHFWKNWLNYTKEALKPLVGVGKVGSGAGERSGGKITVEEKFDFFQNLMYNIYRKKK